jgi:exoribonuclease R
LLLRSGASLPSCCVLGELSKDAWYHYGLATPVYTHFTSPIRRYADILVHRLLAASIGVSSLPLSNADRNKQHDISAVMNRRHRLAQYAQRSSVALHTTIFFSQKSSEMTGAGSGGGVMEDAYIIGLKEEKIDVLVPKYGIEESIDLNDIAADLERKLSTSVAQAKEKGKGDEKKRTLEEERERDERIEKKINLEEFCVVFERHPSLQLLKLEIFQKIQVNIQVKEESGDRKLVLNLVL